MEIAISSTIVNGPWGGGNNFVSNFTDFLKKKNCKVHYYDLFKSLIQEKELIVKNRKKVNYSLLSKFLFYYEKYKS